VHITNFSDAPVITSVDFQVNAKQWKNVTSVLTVRDSKVVEFTGFNLNDGANAVRLRSSRVISRPTIVLLHTAPEVPSKALIVESASRGRSDSSLSSKRITKRRPAIRIHC